MKYNLVFIVILVLPGCNQLLDSKPDISFDKENVLRPNIKFKSNDSTELYIEYWLKNSEKKEITGFSAGVNHSFTILNVLEDTTYGFSVKERSGKRKSGEFSFRTGKIPKNYFSFKKELIDTAVFTGYILVRSYDYNGADFILNNEGDIVWYHSYNSPVRRQFSWTKSETILSGLDSTSITEINLQGEQVLNLNLIEAGYPHFLHHEVLYDDTGQIVTLFTDSVLVEKGVKGKVDRYAYTDGILKLSRSGVPIWKWNVADYMDVPRAIKSLKSFKGRISHSNSLAIDDHKNYLISFRDFGQVWNIHSQTGEVLWKLGMGGDLKMDSSSYFISQHSLEYSNGNLTLFDNGSPRSRPFSRIITFTIDEKSKSAITNNIINLPQQLTSFRMGSAYPIDDEHYLVCSSRKPFVLSVVNKKGEVRWMVTGDQISYRAYYIENPFQYSTKQQ